MLKYKFLLEHKPLMHNFLMHGFLKHAPFKAYS